MAEIIKGNFGKKKEDVSKEEPSLKKEIIPGSIEERAYDAVTPIIEVLKNSDFVNSTEVAATAEKELSSFSNEELIALAEKSTKRDWLNKPSYFYMLCRLLDKRVINPEYYK